MSAFDARVATLESSGLFSEGMELLQVNVGRRCNLTCTHCHLDCSPERSETMSVDTMDRIITVVRDTHCKQVDITGGAPELHPHLRHFITALQELGASIQVRTNLACLIDPCSEGLIDFFAASRVALAASLPCYLEENVDAQRGEGTYARAITAIKSLNNAGYGIDDRLTLDLVYNPAGASLPGDQAGLEAAYRKELADAHGIRFTRLLTIANMPIGRFRNQLEKDGELDAYMTTLERAFNPDVVAGLMCRRQVCVDWDGVLYDCDFNLALGQAVDHGAPSRIAEFSLPALSGRQIVTGPHCYGCTAGSGSSCAGQLAQPE
jgi:radical SAM/Cys-rich protein